MQNHMKLRMCHNLMFVNALLLDIYFDYINMNLYKDGMASNLFNFEYFSLKI